MWIVVLSVIWMNAAGEIQFQNSWEIDSPEECAANVEHLLYNLPDPTGSYEIKCSVKPDGRPA